MSTEKTEPKERYYNIVAGPNKDALFDACKYAYSDNAKLIIDFTVAIGYTMERKVSNRNCIPMAITDIKICGIEHEDGSGESFNLYGYCKADPESIDKSDVSYKPYRFEAYYDTRSRKGCITLIRQ